MMLFDLEDYSTTGTVGTGRVIPEKKFPNKLQGVHQMGRSWMAETHFATRDAHIKAVNEYFLASVMFLPMELRDAAMDKYFEFMDSCREFAIAGKEYWHMIHSLPVKKAYAGVQFQPGDWFYVTEGSETSINIQTEAKYIANTRGQINSYYAQNAPNHPQYKYNDNALEYMSGKRCEYKAVLCGGEFEGWDGSAPGAPSNFNTIKYTPYSEEIDSNYYAKFEALMACEKELFIALEGFDPFVGE
jgi:hypothetical protein